MKTVYICGSFKDFDFSRSVAKRLADSTIPVLISEPGDPQGIDGCLARIDHADIIYASNPRGEIGKSVSMDIGYAVAKGKPIYSLQAIEDPPLSKYVRGNTDVETLIRIIGKDKGDGSIHIKALLSSDGIRVDPDTLLRPVEVDDAHALFGVIESSRAFLQESKAGASDLKDLDSVLGSIRARRQELDNNGGISFGIWFQGAFIGIVGLRHTLQMSEINPL